MGSSVFRIATFCREGGIAASAAADVTVGFGSGPESCFFFLAVDVVWVSAASSRGPACCTTSFAFDPAFPSLVFVGSSFAFSFCVEVSVPPVLASS